MKRLYILHSYILCFHSYTRYTLAVFKESTERLSETKWKEKCAREKSRSRINNNNLNFTWEHLWLCVWSQRKAQFHSIFTISLNFGLIWFSVRNFASFPFHHTTPIIMKTKFSRTQMNSIFLCYYFMDFLTLVLECCSWCKVCLHVTRIERVTQTHEMN